MDKAWSGRRILSVANLKGGVGKSTTAMMIADALSAHQQVRVLLIDLDPQSNLSQMILSYKGLRNVEQEVWTVTDWMRSLNNQNKKPLHSFVATSASGLVEVKEAANTQLGKRGELTLLAASPELRFCELDFDHASHVAGDKHAPRIRMVNHLSEGLDSFAESVDLVIFDCPPGFSTLAQAALSLSDAIISPIQEEPSGIWSLKTFKEFGLTKTLGVWCPDRHRVVLSRIKHQGAKEERIAVRNSLSAAGFERFQSAIKDTVDAHRWSVRPAPDSFTSFNRKYGSQRKTVEELGNEVVTFLRQISPAETNQEHPARV